MLDSVYIEYNKRVYTHEFSFLGYRYQIKYYDLDGGQTINIIAGGEDKANYLWYQTPSGYNYWMVTSTERNDIAAIVGNLPTKVGDVLHLSLHYSTYPSKVDITCLGYVLTFSPNGGAGSSETQIASSDQVNLRANTFTRTGYTFQGWADSADATEAQYTDGQSVTPEPGKTYYAVWKPISYSVVLHANNGTDATTTLQFTYDQSQNLNNSFTNEGKTFWYWAANSDGTGNAFSNNANVKNLASTESDTVHLYAQWIDPVIRIGSADELNTFINNYNSGTYHGSAITMALTADIDIGSTQLGTSSCPFTGTFDGQGHILTISYSGSSDYSGGFFGQIKDCTIQNLKVTGTCSSSEFYTGGVAGKATGTCVFNNCWSDVAMTLSTDGAAGFVGYDDTNDNLTYNNCLFTGKFDGNNDQYFQGFSRNGYANYNNCLSFPQTGTASADDPFADTVQSTKNCYYSNVTTSRHGVTKVESAELETEDFCAKLGDGWELKEGAAYPTPVMEATAAQEEHVVTFDANGGTCDQQGTLTSGQKLASLPTPTREGYTFDGWFNGDTVVTTDTKYTADTTLTANWTIKTFTVTWKNGDTTLKTDTVEYGARPSYSGSAPTKASDAQYDYVFTGWDQELAPITADTTFNAKFLSSLRSYTITWKNGDTLLETDTVAYGETPVYSGETPTKDSDDKNTYIFKGWSPEISEITRDATYTAEFTATPKQSGESGSGSGKDSGESGSGSGKDSGESGSGSGKDSGESGSGSGKGSDESGSGSGKGSDESGSGSGKDSGESDSGSDTGSDNSSSSENTKKTEDTSNTLNTSVSTSSENTASNSSAFTPNKVDNTVLNSTTPTETLRTDRNLVSTTLVESTVNPDGTINDGGIKHNDEYVAKDIQDVQAAVEKQNAKKSKWTKKKATNVIIDMTDGSDVSANLVPKEVLQTVKGENVNVIFDMGAYSWTVNGKDLADTDIKDINIGLSETPAAIKESTVKGIAKKNAYTTLALNHTGEFGFKARLSIYVGRQYKGKYANFYTVNAAGNALSGYARVDRKGYVTVDFNHGGDYVITFSKKHAKP